MRKVEEKKGKGVTETLSTIQDKHNEHFILNVTLSRATFISYLRCSTLSHFCS
jgi:hypothetical protein